MCEENKYFKNRIKNLESELIKERKLSFDLAKEIERLNARIKELEDRDDGK